MPAETDSPGEHRRQERRSSEIPDLQTQFEEILNTVWKSEADWRLNDRLDLALKTRRTA